MRERFGFPLSVGRSSAGSRSRGRESIFTDFYESTCDISDHVIEESVGFDFYSDFGTTEGWSQIDIESVDGTNGGFSW